MTIRTLVALAALAVCAGGCARMNRADGIGDPAGLSGLAGKRIVIVGTVSGTPWQHIVDPRPSHPYETYFDMGRSQIVVYSKEPVSCAGTVRITGTVIRLEGSSGDPRRKEACTEHQVLADSWECLR